MAARGSDREFLKDKIRILNEECADKKQMVEVLTRVEEELKAQIGDWEKEVREIRPLCAQKETQLSEAEEFVKKGNLKVVELKEQIAHNTVDIEKMRRQEEDTLRNTIQAQERTDNLKAQLKHKDTTQYIPTIQKLSRLEQKSNEVETQAHKAQEKVVTLEEDVRSLRGQMAILNQAALKMEYENKSKDEKIVQLEKEIESKRNERYESEQQIDNMKQQLAQLFQNMEQLELEKERFVLNFQ